MTTIKHDNKVIGIIDDDEVFQFILSNIIAHISPNVKIEKFNNGKNAIEFYSKNDDVPDILLLDINMPIMNGWEFLEELKKSLPKIKSNTKIYILTSSIFNADKEKSANYGFIIDFISKPVNEEKVRKLLSMN